MLLRKLLFPVMLLVTVSSLAQETTFDTSGIVTTLNYDKKKGVRYLAPAPLGEPFWALDSQYKARARTVLLDKIKSTSEVLEKNAFPTTTRQFLVDFYSSDQVDEYLLELGRLKTWIKADDKNVPFQTTYLHAFATPFKKYLFTKSDTIFSARDTARKKGIIAVELWRLDPFNQFTLDYYATTSSSSNMNTLSLKKIDLFDKGLTVLRDSVAFTIQQSRTAAAQSRYSTDLLDEMKRRQQAIRQNAIYTFFHGDAGRDWFFAWLWYRGGDLRINPLEFTSQDYFSTLNPADTAKEKLYRNYLQAQVNWMQAHDTTGNYMKFRGLLLQLDSAKGIYAREDKVKKMSAASETTLNALLKTKKLLNKVEIPEEGRFFSYSVTQPFTAPHNCDKLLSSPISEGETKTIYLFNVRQDKKAGLLEKVTENTDQSEVTKILDTLGGMLGQVAALAVKLNPYSNILGGWNKGNMRVPVIEPPAQLLEEIRGGHYPAPIRPTTRLVLVKLLVDKKLYDENVFNDVIRINRYDTLSYFDSTYKPIEKQQLLIKKFERNYIEAFAAKVKQLGEGLMRDSINLAYLHRMVLDATPLFPELKEVPDKQPLYSTAVLTTTPNKKSTLEEITPYVVGTEKDTTKLNAFVFERGKHYRFQISAGLAYTVSAITQSTATVENGKVNITNSSQQYQLGIGIHVYLGRGLMLKDNRLFRFTLDRVSFYTGIGVPEPLGNFYFGLSYDVYPGLKLMGGMRLYQKNKYEIQNDVIVSERKRYEPAFPFFALQVDPAGLLKALNIFKSN